MKRRNAVAEDEASPQESLDRAVADYSAAKAKSRAMQSAARIAEDEAVAAGKAMAAALTALTGISFDVGTFGRGFDIK